MICNGCKIDKGATETNFAFRKDAQCLRHTCRDCQRAQRKERFNKDKYGDDAYYRNLRRQRLQARRRRKKNPEINRKAMARWRDKNREKYRAIARAYRIRRGSAYMKEWRERNRDWYNAYMRDWRRLNSLKVSDTNQLMDLIASALPNGLSGELRDEVIQELLIRVLSGKVRVSQLKESIKPLVTSFYRDYANRALLSLDALISGSEDLTLGETVAG